VIGYCLGGPDGITSRRFRRAEGRAEGILRIASGAAGGRFEWRSFAFGEHTERSQGAGAGTAIVFRAELVWW